jgi:hypothetical protein
MQKISLKKIYEDLQLDPKAQASANALLLMDKLKNNPTFQAMLNQIYLPSDKYKAVKKFASLLGIPEERFIDFATQQENQKDA